MTDLTTSALIVVDMQNDFLATGGHYDVRAARERDRRGRLDAADLADLAAVYLNPPNTFAVRAGYEGVVERVRDVAHAALDAGMATIFVTAAYDPRAAHRPPLFLADPDRRHYGCHPGTWGADLVEPLKPLAAHGRASLVTKPTFDAFYETGLGDRLRAGSIKTLYIAGVETNVCVLFTVLSALSRGFDTVVLEDCVATSRPDLQVHTLEIMDVAKGRLMTGQSFITSLGNP